VYWPAFLMAAGMDLPKKIFAKIGIFVSGRKNVQVACNIQSAQPIVGVWV